MKKWSLFFLKVISSISFLISILLIKLRLCPEPDPWRRTVSVGLRSEASKFGLSAFALRAIQYGADKQLSGDEERQRIAERLARFLQTEPIAHFTLRHHRFCSYRVANPFGDLVVAYFSPSGELRRIAPVLDDRHPIAIKASDRREIDFLILGEYNRTRQLPEHSRIRVFIRKVMKGCISVSKPAAARPLASAYAKRILNGSCVSFETGTMDPAKRFDPPDFRIRRIVGAGFLNIVCRRASDKATDIWMQVHHTGGDGVPIQELLTRLENAWGSVPGVLFPNDTGVPPKILPCYAGTQERRLQLLTDYIDFSPFLRIREDLKKQLAEEGIEALPLGALFLWCLAHQPEFQGAKFATAVDVPPNKIVARGVDLVAICPADYMDRCGFAAYLRSFNQLIVDARNRCTQSYQAMRGLALLPPIIAWTALRLNSSASRKTFGTVGISIVKDAKVVVGTMADQGFDGGFILIGNMSLPCANGGTSASVSVKGDYEAIRGYPMAIRRAIQAAPRLSTYSGANTAITSRPR